jgi:hypothetical protein
LYDEVVIVQENQIVPAFILNLNKEQIPSLMQTLKYSFRDSTSSHSYADDDISLLNAIDSVVSKPQQNPVLRHATLPENASDNNDESLHTYRDDGFSHAGRFNRQRLDMVRDAEGGTVDEERIELLSMTASLSDEI